MGLSPTNAYTDDSTGVILTAAYVSFKGSQVTILQDATGAYVVSALAGIWKDKDAKDDGKAVLGTKNVVVQASADDIQKTGVYNLLYTGLKTLMPEAVDT